MNKGTFLTMTMLQNHTFQEDSPDCSRVYIFGAGPVPQQLVPIAVAAGFYTVVLDEQLDLVTPERFPLAHQIIPLESFEQALSGLEINAQSYLVIATPDHNHDKTVLTQALRSQAGYIGMVRSKRDRNALYQTLIQEGFTLDELERVHSPIGLAIRAKLPAEIAVSITAELIKVRAEQNN